MTLEQLRAELDSAQAREKALYEAVRRTKIPSQAQLQELWAAQDASIEAGLRYNDAYLHNR